MLASRFKLADTSEYYCFRLNLSCLEQEIATLFCMISEVRGFFRPDPHASKHDCHKSGLILISTTQDPWRMDFLASISIYVNFFLCICVVRCELYLHLCSCRGPIYGMPVDPADDDMGTPPRCFTYPLSCRGLL